MTAKRKALVVGIDYYSHMPVLQGCVNDARGVEAVLARHEDGRVNFEVERLRAEHSGDAVPRETLRGMVRELFADDPDVALLYFAGHGYLDSTGGFLCASDCRTGDDGLALGEILTMANNSRARNRIVILDCCHAGIAAVNPNAPRITELSENLTLLTASTSEQKAGEEDGRGVFTTLLVDALKGAAANLVGEISPGSVYAHIDQSLGWWGQRPVFKSNVKSFVSLREVEPPVPLVDLRQIATLFPDPGFEFPLDPGYEPESPEADPKKTPIFATLQKYNRVNLLVPVDAPHMWHAAMQRKRCRLTPLGEHYRSLVSKNRI